jgi:Phospholipase_D-nuclease N-terminal
VLVLGEGGVLIEVVLLVYCVLNIITTPEHEVRNLPKLLWLMLVILLPLIGGIAWLVAGRPVAPSSRRGGLPYKGNTGQFPEYERPGRAVAQNPDDDDAFLQGLRERAEEQRKKAAEQARRLREDEQPPPV